MIYEVYWDTENWNSIRKTWLFWLNNLLFFNILISIPSRFFLSYVSVSMSWPGRQGRTRNKDYFNFKIEINLCFWPFYTPTNFTFPLIWLCSLLLHLLCFATMILKSPFLKWLHSEESYWFWNHSTLIPKCPETKSYVIFLKITNKLQDVFLSVWNKWIYFGFISIWLYNYWSEKLYNLYEFGL